MRKFTLALLLGGLIGLWGCTNELATIIGSKWVCEQNGVTITLVFAERTCTATQTTNTGAPAIEKKAPYTHNPPDIKFFMPDGVERTGIFYDDYVRLVVKVNDNTVYTFDRSL